MRKIIKITLCIVLILSFALTGLTAYGVYVIPDCAYTSENSISYMGLFYAQSDNNGTDGNSSVLVSAADLKLMNVIPLKKITLRSPERRYVAAGGELIGIKLFTQGIIVVGTESFVSDSGTVNPAENAGIKAGDIILEVNGAAVKSNEEFTGLIRSSGGKTVTLLVQRNNDRFYASLIPEKTAATGMYKGGMWIRDSVGGIGTLTYSDVINGTVAALGHGIYDADTGDILPASGGEIYTARLMGVEKGVSGKAGQLCGTIDDNELGTLNENNDNGIYGTLSSVLSADDIYPVAHPDEIHAGAAQIICTVTDGTKQYYDITIEKVGKQSAYGRDMVIKIEDTSLLSITGGIVQGMSGSPIIQDGMLAGAVTHVFLNDPAKGYGIFAEEMLTLSDAQAAAVNDAA